MTEPVLVEGNDYRYYEDGNPKAVVRLINIIGKAPGGKYDQLQVRVVHPVTDESGEEDKWFTPGKYFTLTPGTQKSPANMPIGWELKSP